MTIQSYQSEPLPAALASRAAKATTWSFIDLLEPALLLGVGVLVSAPAHFAPKTILLGLATLLIPYLLRWIFYGAPSTSTLADLPLALLFLVMTPITIWVTPYFWDKTWPELIRMVWGGAVFMGVINWAWPVWQTVDKAPEARYRLTPRLWLLLLAYVGLGGGLAVLGLLNMQVMAKLPFIDLLARQLAQVHVAQLAIDDQFNPNRVAALLVLYAPLPFAFLLASGRTKAEQTDSELRHSTAHKARGAGQVGRAFFGLLLGAMGLLLRKSFWLALWLFFAGGLLLTQSRAGLLALAVATLVVVILTGRRSDGWLRIVGSLFVIVFLLGMAYTVLGLEYTNPLALISAVGARFDPASTKLTSTDTLSGRAVIWQRALYGIADQPLTGMGLGAFDQIAHEPYPALADYRPGDIHHAHNLFLQTALDLGMPGAIGFMALVIIAFISIVRLYGQAPVEGQLSVWAVALLGSFVAFLIYNLLDGLTLGARPAVAMWFFLGLATVAEKYRQS